jgi:hypothetical protein
MSDHPKPASPLEDVAESIRLMRERHKSGQGEYHSAMCRLSLPMAETLYEHATDLHTRLADAEKRAAAEAERADDNLSRIETLNHQHEVDLAWKQRAADAEARCAAIGNERNILRLTLRRVPDMVRGMRGACLSDNLLFETAADALAARIESELGGGEPTADGDTCWHCHVTLAPDEPRRPRCESCPDECDIEGCDEPGCVGDAEPGPDPFPDMCANGCDEFRTAGSALCDDCQPQDAPECETCDMHAATGGEGKCPTCSERGEPRCAEVIKCDHGDDCPGHASATDRPCNYEPRCAECEAVINTAQMRCGFVQLGRICTQDDGPAPDWCPRRKR